MSPTSRRIYFYWLLLLLPTLAVGVGSIVLLQREQGRIATQSAYAIESRQAAAETRARLIVETVELLVGDVEAGLLEVIAAEPAAGLDPFLDQLEKSNPLVRTAFRAAADGRILRPDTRATSEDARGFHRRFARQFGTRPPWAAAPLGWNSAPDSRESFRAQDETAVRREVSANVAQAQSARRDVQELFKNSAGLAMDSAAVAGRAPSSVPPAPVPASEYLPQSPRAAGSGAKREAASPGRGAPLASSSPFAIGPRQEADPVGMAAKFSGKGGGTERRGWVPLTVDGRLHLFGWVQAGAAGDVRGVEMDIGALISRFGGALPVETSAGEGYALRDDQGRVVHQVGAVPRGGAPVARVPFAAALLPGWDVAAFVTTGPTESGNPAAIVGLGALLVAIFVAAILAGGSLLLRQARRSEEEAAQKTSFVANVSHEFKTPLTTIRLYSELLEQGRVRDPAQGADYLRTIGRETQRLARLVNNALDFSRLEQGKKSYARESVELVATFERLLDTHAPRVAEARLVLRRDLPASPLSVDTDPDALEQIVLNLIDNACKYAAGGGEVLVSVRSRPGGGAEVCVADRGPGVPLEHRERIFEKFHRVDDALTAEKSGAGLGLSIARQLARGLGGELRYIPRPGAGAEFQLELP